MFDAERIELKEYQKSQLFFYGYVKNQYGFEKITNEIDKDLLKIVNYFEIEGLKVDFDLKVKIRLNELRERGDRKQELLNLGTSIKNGKIDLKDFNDFKDFLRTIPRKLKSHQIKAAYHLYSVKNGANFSVPGSGKTSVVLSVFEKLKQEKKCNILFVVGPPSSFQPWKHEFKETLGRVPKTIILSGENKVVRKSHYFKSAYNAGELYLITFQTILNDYDHIITFFNQKKIEVYFVIDEAHYMKQIGGSWASSLLKITNYVKFRCVLTGTPIPKGYQDLFNPFDFLYPNSPPLSESEKIQINIWDKKNNTKKIQNLIHQKIGPLFYRVRKTELGLKPAVFNDPILVKMNHNEGYIYEMVKAKIFELSKTDFLRNEYLLSSLWKGRIIRLRQAVSYPKLLLTAIEGYNENLIEHSELYEKIQNYDKMETPAKIARLIEEVLTLRKKHRKVVIWANFIGTLELIKRHFRELGLRVEMIYGKTPIKSNNQINYKVTRDGIRDEFVNPKSGLDILIANPAACAESISLHKTCYDAIYYELSYNCAQYLQSLDRIHRVGGSELRTANYHFLQYENSIDQDIKSNLELKAAKMYEIIEKEYAIYNLDLFDESSSDDITAYKRLFK